MPQSPEPSPASYLRSARASQPGACLHCGSPLGSNDVLALPIGRRFAFEIERRRLWIVCGTCRRWSLSMAYTPSMTIHDVSLSEMLAECERQHRDAPRGFETENVRLARHTSGVELIRVDGASRAELAEWRYGDVLLPTPWRRARALLGERAVRWLAERRDGLRATLAGAPYLIGGIAVASLSSTALAQATALGLVLLAFFKLFTQRSAEHERHLRRLTAGSRVVLGRITAVDGRSFPLHADQAWRIRLVRRSGADGCCLRVPARRSAGGSAAAAHDVDGHEAVRALRLAFPDVSRPGVEGVAVRKAAAAIESAGGAERFLAVVHEEAAQRGLRYATLGELPLELRLPLEIAVDEVYEHQAFAGDGVLSMLDWRGAEASATLQGAS